jgi:hypothetical protein
MKYERLINEQGEWFGIILYPVTKREHNLAHAWGAMTDDVWNQVRTSSYPAPDGALKIGRGLLREMIIEDLDWHRLTGRAHWAIQERVNA